MKLETGNQPSFPANAMEHTKIAISYDCHWPLGHMQNVIRLGIDAFSSQPRPNFGRVNRMDGEETTSRGS